MASRHLCPSSCRCPCCPWPCPWFPLPPLLLSVQFTFALQQSSHVHGDWSCALVHNIVDSALLQFLVGVELVCFEANVFQTVLSVLARQALLKSGTRSCEELSHSSMIDPHTASLSWNSLSAPESHRSVSVSFVIAFPLVYGLCRTTS